MRTTLGLEKIARFGYNLVVVDLQKIPTIDKLRFALEHVHQDQQAGIFVPRQERKAATPGETNLRIFSQGNSLRRVPVCGAG